jgi:glycine/D-amino acid oxidase-like deaminating enzyme
MSDHRHMSDHRDGPSVFTSPIIVVGGGVMGFACALRLLESGNRNVTLIAESFARISSTRLSISPHRAAGAGEHFSPPVLRCT